ncbi:MAG: polyisoprenoid-binding protein [Gammaproteobacteria bacterium]|nr:polyisoprenoid-binding protein [Gammaproteobacteria bacterium]
MRNILLISALFAMSFSSYAAPETYTIEPTHTYPHFRISHLGFSTLQGRFNSTKGKLTIDTEKNTGTIDIIIDATSIDTAHKKRDEHLSSPDFLNVAEFPEITYKSTNVVITGTTAKANGKLTIMGVTKPVSLNITKMKCGVHPFNKKQICGFDATTNIKRSDFGIKYGLPAIGDEMELIIEVEAVKD